MKLTERLQHDMKEAMKAKDKDRLSTIRMVISELKYAQAATSMSQELSEEDALKVVESYHKKLGKSLGDYPEGPQQDAIRREMAVLEDYMPKKAGRAETEAVVAEVIGSTDERNFGVLMKQVLARLGQAADGKLVSEVLKGKLG